MRIRQPIFEFIDCNKVMQNIERGIRVCYKSEDKMGPGSDVAIISKILIPKNGIKHESVLEHGVITAAFVTDRGVSHEAVRHRLMAVSQESTRYCNYSKDKYHNEITVIDPYFFDPEEPMLTVKVPTFVPDVISKRGVVSSYVMANMNSFDVWVVSLMTSEWAYNTLTTTFGRSAQEARTVLPNSLKTEFQITCNVREWRHILKLRTGRDAHPQIRQIMVPFGRVLAAKWPCLFGEFADVEHPRPAKQVFSTIQVGEEDELLGGSSTEEQSGQGTDTDSGLRQGTGSLSEGEAYALPGDPILQSGRSVGEGTVEVPSPRSSQSSEG